MRSVTSGINCFLKIVYVRDDAEYPRPLLFLMFRIKAGLQDGIKIVEIYFLVQQTPCLVPYIPLKVTEKV